MTEHAVMVLALAALILPVACALLRPADCERAAWLLGLDMDREEEE